MAFVTHYLTSRRGSCDEAIRFFHQFHRIRSSLEFAAIVVPCAVALSGSRSGPWNRAAWRSAQCHVPGWMQSEGFLTFFVKLLLIFFLTNTLSLILSSALRLFFSSAGSRLKVFDINSLSPKTFRWVFRPSSGICRVRQRPTVAFERKTEEHTPRAREH